MPRDSYVVVVTERERARARVRGCFGENGIRSVKRSHHHRSEIQKFHSNDEC